MNRPKVCYVCNTSTKEIHQNLLKLKSLYTQTPIVVLCKRFQSANEPNRLADDGFESRAICHSCMNRFNEYDAACGMVSRLETQLRSLFNRTDTTKVNTPQLTRRILVSKSKTVETVDSDDSFEWPEMNAKRRCKVTARKWYSCSQCPARYLSNIQLLAHRQSHQVSHWICRVCNYRYMAGDNHKKMHCNRPELQCVYCDEHLANQKELIVHMHSHTGARLAVCHICGKQYSGKNNYHLLSHGDVRNFKCSSCSRLFRDRGHLNRHMKTHTGERSFGCEFADCPRKFSCRYNMRVHMVAIHKVDDGNFGKVHNCTICNVSFARAKLLQEHYRKKHDSITSHKSLENTSDDGHEQMEQ